MKIACYTAGPVGTNCYIVSDDNGVTAIIDCEGDPAPLFDYVAKNNLKPTHILLTHGHYDHIGAVKAVKEKYGCTVVGGKKEIRVLTDAKINCSYYNGVPIEIHPDVLVDEGDIVQVGEMYFTVMVTPGHTEGSLCYSSGTNIFSGDTLFQGSCGRTDLPTGDWGQMMASMKRLKALPGDYAVYPGHGPATSLEEERRSNPYMA